MRKRTFISRKPRQFERNEGQFAFIWPTPPDMPEASYAPNALLRCNNGDWQTKAM
jgi:hypothetical protein